MVGKTYDIVIVGAGTAGLPASIFAARRGARVCVIEAAGDIGGTLHYSNGEMSGAGTKLQKARGIEDSPQAHFDDAMRITKGTTDQPMLRVSLPLQAKIVDWLMDEGFDMEDDMPKLNYGHEAYRTPRTYWGKQQGRSILAVLRRLFEAERAKGGIDLFLNTKMARVLQNESGAVTGVALADGRIVEAASTVLTTGGYAAGHDLFKSLHNGITLYSGSYEYSKGEGIIAGRDAGALVHGAEKYLPSFGGVLNHLVDPPRYRGLTGLTPQYREIWEIYVNETGERFVAEDHESVDVRERALMKQKDKCFIIFDEAMRQAAPNLFMGWMENPSREDILANPTFHGADTLEDLAEKAGIDVMGLHRTVTAYNQSVETKSDAFGRKHFPMKIEKGPFYAITFVAWSVKSYAGLKTDTRLRVLRPDGSVIPNLYAAGEILGGGLLSGNTFVGGMSVTPSLAFGKLLGEEILPVGLSAQAAD
jgi:fumarate reductase flavoprotein subunit